jgi:hypothetical protein
MSKDDSSNDDNDADDGNNRDSPPNNNTTSATLPLMKNKKGKMVPVCVDCRQKPRVKGITRCYACKVKQRRDGKDDTPCMECGKMSSLLRIGLCDACYARYHRAEKRKRDEKDEDEEDDVEQEESNIQTRRKLYSPEKRQKISYKQYLKDDEDDDDDVG